MDEAQDRQREDGGREAPPSGFEAGGRRPCRTAPGARPAAPGLLALILFPALLQALEGPDSLRVEFREPRLQAYYLDPGGMLWEDGSLVAYSGRPDGPAALITRQVVWQAGHPLEEEDLPQGLALASRLEAGLVVLEARSPRQAAEAAASLALRPGTLASYPVMRRSVRLSGAYHPAPNDDYFGHCWHLENRNIRGVPLGVDLNLRGAWSQAQGRGITVAVGDTGVDLDHPDLAGAAGNPFHYNFGSHSEDGSYIEAHDAHGTAVAGLIAARLGNGTGTVGVAPLASLASWVVFEELGQLGAFLVDDLSLSLMYRYRNEEVAVQNHSWGPAQVTPQAIDLLSDRRIGQAVSQGRGGRGVVLVRAAGNERQRLLNSNDSGYGRDPRSILVGAVRSDGRPAGYSVPGATVLVAAPSGDDGFPGLATTDLQGADGYVLQGSGDREDYLLEEDGFSGTSGSSPLVAGLAALILETRPELSYRDVQQILVHSAVQPLAGDPDISLNGAGYPVSHSTGYGVPDAGEAVRLARIWSPAPEPVERSVSWEGSLVIPDSGLRIGIRGGAAPPELERIAALPSLGPFADGGTDPLPLAYAGLADTDPADSLEGRAALVRRGEITFAEKIRRVAGAGASLALIHNNVEDEELLLMGGTEFSPIPAYFIGQRDGEALADLLSRQPDLEASVSLDEAELEFEFPDAMVCGHVGVWIDTSHSYRGDLRIVLTSPAGTRSVLQAYNQDESPGPRDWLYWSVRHFGEPSAGTWTLSVLDQKEGDEGRILSAVLRIRGRPILDEDGDGLDDGWERTHLGSLGSGPLSDPDGDGYANAREQAMGTSPILSDRPLRLSLSLWSERLLRLSWPGNPEQSYQILRRDSLEAPWEAIALVEGRFPQCERLIPISLHHPGAFYSVRQAH